MSSSRMSMRASTGESGMRVLPEMFKHRLHQLAEETVDSLQKIWKEAGYEEVECQRLLGDLLNKMKITCSEELAAEQQILEHAKQEVELNVREFVSLASQLGREANVEHLARMNYTDKLAELEKLISDVTIEVAQRQKLLNVELVNIQDMVNSLGEEFPKMELFDGPENTPELSDVRLNLMKKYGADLEVIRSRRSDEVCELLRDCKQHISDLVLMDEGFATMPESDLFADCDSKLQRFMINGDCKPFGVNKKDIVILSKRLKSFIEEKESRRLRLANTGAEIARMWTLLRVPSVERDQFTASFQMNLSMETICRGDDELDRLKDIRTKSLGRVVGSIRSDISTLWDEAGYDSEETRRREFPLYFAPIEGIEDSAVELHEAYFHMLRAKVDELKPILLKVARRENVVQERVELEHIQMNPERLTARGPNAREERKREENMSSRVKNLEKNTKELVTAIQAWEEVNGPFVYGGERYFDRIAQQEETYVEIRDSLRNARKKNNGKLEVTLPINKTTVQRKPAPGMTPGHNSTAKKALQSHQHNNSESLCLNDVNIALLNQQLNAAHAADQRHPNAENLCPPRESNASNNSDETTCTSATEVKERPSTATVVKAYY